ncbi:MAG: DUF58 domain-containing protein [Candidatus Heimdallarchaeota archaeon]|nr:DUF58 domain-containing protein [Candidatus Heimdallarchaeota archaeon]MBY8994060.1 DUF58 domain-containing protein [Candidatus Heimdallarchaeota archaeon]
MFSPKIRWTLVLFFSILLLGIGFQEWVFLISLIPLTILIIFYFFTSPPEKLDLEIIRELDQNRFQEGEHIEISIRIRNKGKQAIDMLEIIDKLPLQVSLKSSSNHIITSLDAGEETEFRYVISCDYRGRWNLGPTHVRARNFIDSAYTVETYDNTEDNIVVIPNFEIIRDMPFRTKYPKISDGPFHSKLKGEGLDFSGVREYLHSDSLARINWPATAKYGRLFTNEYELFRTADLLLILDATEKSASILEDQIKAILSLSEHFLKYKCRVGLMIIRDAVDRFNLSSSRQQLIKFTEKLIDVQATKIENFNILESRIKTNIDHYFPMNCLTIIVTPLIHPAVNKMLIDAAKRRRNSFFLVPSIISSEWRFIQDKENPPNLLVHQNLLLRRQTEITRVFHEGLVVFEWDVNTPFSVFMNKLKQIAVKRGRR